MSSQLMFPVFGIAFNISTRIFLLMSLLEREREVYLSHTLHEFPGYFSIITAKTSYNLQPTNEGFGYKGFIQSQEASQT